MKHDWPKEFAAFREKSGMTQAQLAHVLGMCEKTIWNIEQGRTEPQMRNKLKFNALVAKHKEAKRNGFDISSN